MQDEFYATAFRKKIYNNLEELQVDVDVWNVVSLPLPGEKETGSAGKQPASDNLTDWNGQGERKSPSNYFTIPRNKLWHILQAVKFCANSKTLMHKTCP